MIKQAYYRKLYLKDIVNIPYWVYARSEFVSFIFKMANDARDIFQLNASIKKTIAFAVRVVLFPIAIIAILHTSKRRLSRYNNLILLDDWSYIEETLYMVEDKYIKNSSPLWTK